jgi:hypothetical protein
VGESHPIGLTAEDACPSAAIAGSKRFSLIFKIFEANPELDLSGQTSNLAAMMDCIFSSRK